MSNTDEQLPTHIADFIRARESGAITLGISNAPIDTLVEAKRLANTCPIGMVDQVEREIAKIQKRLADTNGYEKITGSPIYAVPEGSHARRALEIQLHNLKEETLPYTKQRASEIEAARALLPSQEELIAAELERSERIDARALEIVEELEAKQKAERMLAQRHQRPTAI